MDIVVGTAGHVDHGKTALIKALTGIDADRLPEEKQRGITIDLGFAELDLGHVHIGFVDVPGHERFVKNMLAGASGIDLVMLVIAADEGVMPQTREHFDICRLLGIGAGLVVVTKADTVDAEMMELVRAEADELVQHSFLERAPVISVSSKTGEGLDELTVALKQAANGVSIRDNGTMARLPIDRSFTVKGFGTIVTGTLATGSIAEADELVIMPEGRKARVRGLQVHGKRVPRVTAGHRTAVNLAGVDHHEIKRGMTLCEIGSVRPTQIIDAEIEVLASAPRPLRSRQRVRFHIGTSEVLARVAVLNAGDEVPPGETDFVQFRLEDPVSAVLNDTFIIRSYSPQITIGGGRALDAFAVKHRRRELDSVRPFLSNLSGAGDDLVLAYQFIKAAGTRGISVDELRTRTGWNRERSENAITARGQGGSIIEADGVFLERTEFEQLTQLALGEISKYHLREPLANGINRETLRERAFSFCRPAIFKYVLTTLERENKIVVEKDLVRASSHSQQLSGDESAVHSRLNEIYERAKLEVPKLDDALRDAVAGTKLGRDQARKIFQLLLKSGRIVKASEEFYFSALAINDLLEKLREHKANSADGLIDVAAFKEIANVSRKYAIPLLEYLDREKITRRAGDKRSIL